AALRAGAEPDREPVALPAQPLLVEPGVRGLGGAAGGGVHGLGRRRHRCRADQGSAPRPICYGLKAQESNRVRMRCPINPGRYTGVFLPMLLEARRTIEELLVKFSDWSQLTLETSRKVVPPGASFMPDVPPFLAILRFQMRRLANRPRYAFTASRD